jgi:hypothetical protein
MPIIGAPPGQQHLWPIAASGAMSKIRRSNQTARFNMTRRAASCRQCRCSRPRRRAKRHCGRRSAGERQSSSTADRRTARPGRRHQSGLPARPGVDEPVRRGNLIHFGRVPSPDHRTHWLPQLKWARSGPLKSSLVFVAFVSPDLGNAQIMVNGVAYLPQCGSPRVAARKSLFRANSKKLETAPNGRPNAFHRLWQAVG